MRARADVVLLARKDGPGVLERIQLMDSARAAEGAVRRHAAAVRSCTFPVSVRNSEGGSKRFDSATIVAGPDSPTGLQIRYANTSGPKHFALTKHEFTQGDAVISVVMDEDVPGQDAIVQRAHVKAQTALGR